VIGTFTTAGEMVMESCCKCGVPFAMTRDFYEARRRDGGSFHCPVGHAQHYTETTESRLRKQLDAAERSAKWKQEDLEHTRTQLKHEQWKTRAERAAKTKLKRRVIAGACPCCQRTFANVAEHMRTMHPEAVEAALLKTE